MVIALVKLFHVTLILIIKNSGDLSEGATPDPIPNSEVKTFSADGTARATGWESRTLPGTNI